MKSWFPQREGNLARVGFILLYMCSQVCESHITACVRHYLVSLGRMGQALSFFRPSQTFLPYHAISQATHKFTSVP